MPISARKCRRHAAAFLAATAALTTTAISIFAAAPARADPSPGSATAIAGKVDLDLQLLGGVLGALPVGGPAALDVPLANLVLGQATAPTAAGDSANFTNSVLRLRDDLINTLHLPGPEADLLKADVVSGTARVIRGPGGYAQAYATVTNLRLFLPVVNLPGADANNGILKIDAVSAQATCVPGQKPNVSAKLPTTVLLLGHQIPVPVSGDIPLNVGVAKVDVHLSPVTTTDTSGASAAVEARISIDAVGLAKVSGVIILASASCTSPDAVPAGSAPTSGAAAGAANVTQTAAAAGGSPSATPAAKAAQGNASDPALAATGASGALVPMAVIAVVLVAGGVALLVFLRKKAARPPEN